MHIKPKLSVFFAVLSTFFAAHASSANEVDFRTEEIWHDMGAVSKNGYEWFYFDVTNPDGNTITVIFLGPNPGDISYVRNVYRELPPFSWFKETGNLVREYQGMVIQAGLPNGERFESQDFRKGQEHVRFTADPFKLRINDSMLTMTMGSNGLPVYRLRFNVADPRRHTSAEGDLVFESTMKSWKHEDGYDFYTKTKDGSELYHKWIVPVPHARVTGHYRLTTNTGSTTAVTVTGTGYHDHNYGTLRLPDTFRGWYWGRGHFGDKSVIYTQVWPKKTVKFDVKPYQVAYVATSEDVILDTKDVQFNFGVDSDFAQAKNGMRFPSLFSFKASDGKKTYEFAVKNDSLIHQDVSFYLRHSASAELRCIDGSCPSEQGEFITEQMDMKRFMLWMVKEALLPRSNVRP